MAVSRGAVGVTSSVGRLAISAVGAYLGSFTPIGASGGWALGSMLGNALLPEHLPGVTRDGSHPTDLRATGSSLGPMIPIVKGRARLAGNIIWSTDIDLNPVTTVEDVGGEKGGGPQQEVTTTTYNPIVDCAFAICQGEMAGVRRIWSRGKLLYDRTAGASTSSYIASGNEWETATFYPGSETQAVDPTIEAAAGVGQASAFLGTCYMVFTGLKEEFRQIEFEVIEDGGELYSYQVYETVVEDATPTKIWYLPTKQEVWVAISNSTVDGYAHLLVYDLTTGARVDSILPPGNELAGTDDMQQGYINEAAGLMFLSSHTNGAPEAPGAIIDIHTRSVVANFGVTLDGQYDSFTGEAYVLAGDENTIVWAKYVGGGDYEWRAGEWTTAGQIAPYATATSIAGGLPAETAVLDSHGVWWACTALHLVRMDPHHTGFITAIPIYDQAPDYTAWDIDRPNTHYCSVRDCLYILALQASDGYYYIIKYDIATGAWSTVVSFNDAEVGNIPTSFAYDEKADQFCVERNNDCVIRYAAATGTRIDKLTIAETSADIILDPVQTPFFGGTPSVYVGNVHFGATLRGVLEIRFNTINPQPRLLSDVVTELCAPVLDASEIDVSSLTDSVDGYVLNQATSIRNALAPLQGAYFFDAVESDGLVKFVRRGTASVVAISDDDLAAHENGTEVPALVSLQRALETELPREARFYYYADDADYQTGVQYDRRQTGLSAAVLSIDAPVVFTDDGAKEVTSKTLYSIWGGRVLVEFSTTMKYAYLEPTDVITLSAEGTSYTVRLLDVTEDNGVLRWRAVTEDSSIFTQAGTGGGYASITQSVVAPGGISLHALDIPLLRDEDDGPCFYALTSGAPAQLGAELWVSDDGASYASADVAFLAFAVVGRATTALGDFAGGNQIDDTTSVTVVLEGGTLSGCTDLELLAGTYTAYLAGELVAFGTATLIATNTYTLKRFLRGRKGTEQYMATHAVGDRFVLLGTSTTRRVRQAQADVDVLKYYKTPAVGQSVRSASARKFTNTGVSQMPLAPAHLGAGVSANSAWDIVFTWVRQSRIGQQWASYADVPLGETSASYRVDIYTNDSFTTLLRSITSTTETATYTNAQQTTDFGFSVTSVNVRVVQISAEVADGFPAEATLTAAIPVSHRYWRINGVSVPGSHLEISELQLLASSVNVTASATKTSSDVPGFGALADIFDGSLTTRCFWTAAVAEAGAFYIKFDFGSAIAVTGVKQGGYDTSDRYMDGFVLQYSDDDAAWTTLRTKSGLAYPGNNTLSSEYLVQ